MTQHQIINADSAKLTFIDSGSVNLIVTSPPYPMVSMWDELFISQDDTIKSDLDAGRGYVAFNKMHNILNVIWCECDRVLADQGFICINIGDATRTLTTGNFQMYPNHTKIIEFFSSLGYSVLPDILWHKPTNAPNKFMGSGMYPAGAYITQEHEYILIFRKGSKRTFSNAEKAYRKKSAYFWEERNVWFSDLWCVNGTAQIMNKACSRSRNAAFTLEIPYRLVNMYSIAHDTVLDPFCGLGTTNLACIAAERNSIGVELDNTVAALARERIAGAKDILNDVIRTRIEKHKIFLDTLSSEERAQCYNNQNYNFDVKTKHETALHLSEIAELRQSDDNFYCMYV